MEVVKPLLCSFQRTVTPAWADTGWLAGHFFVIVTLRTSLQLDPGRAGPLLSSLCAYNQHFVFKTNKVEAFIPSVWPSCLGKWLSRGWWAATFPRKHTQEKELSPTSFCGEDFGGSSVTKGENQDNFGIKDLTRVCLQGSLISLFFLAFLLSKPRFVFSGWADLESVRGA